MVSVLMSVYKGERPEHLARALDSIIEQSEAADEIVLVEDGPLTAELYEVTARYEMLCAGAGKQQDPVKRSRRYPPLHRVRLAKNQGLGPALAAGMRACRGDLIARMDTDDIAVGDRLRLQKRYMEAHPDISAVGGDICEFTDEADLYRAQAANLRIKHMPVGADALYRYGKLRNPLNHMTVMLRKSDIETVGGYRKRPLLEDYDLWSRLLAGGCRIDNIPEILVYARVGEGFSDRRGGLRYFMEYASLRRMQLRIGYLHGREYLIAMAATAVMTLVPARVRAGIYTLLRS